MNILGPLLLLAFAGQVKAWWAQPTGYGGGHAQGSAHASATAHASGYGATHTAGYGASTHSSGYGGGHAAAAGQQGGNYSPPGYGYGSYTKPVDCVVSAWGAWSQPDASGYSSRFRQVKTTPTNGGRSCPVLVETKLVTIDCKMGPWGDWVAIDGAPGNYNRKRDTLVHPLNGGQSCPPCTEYKRGNLI